MKKLFVFLALAVMMTVVAGCSVTTKMITRDRVDQDLTSTAGNQGYLQGTAPAVGERKSTKTYIEVQVEAQAIDKEDRTARKAVEPAAPTTNFEASTANQRVSPETQLIETKEEFADYKVQKGETLQKISLKLYGTTKKWKKLFNLNKEMLKSPDKIRPGMVIKVPASGAKEDKGNEFTK